MNTLYDVGSILVVEDDIWAAEKLLNQLNVLGLSETVFAPTLDIAKEHSQQECIDVALLDVNLAHGASSIDLGRELSRAGASVVFMSGYADDSMAIATRGFAFIEKPISLPRLKAAMHRAFIRRAPPVVETAVRHA